MTTLRETIDRLRELLSLRARRERELVLRALTAYSAAWLDHCEGEPMPSEIQGKHLVAAARMVMRGEPLIADYVALLEKWSERA